MNIFILATPHLVSNTPVLRLDEIVTFMLN